VQYVKKKRIPQIIFAEKVFFGFQPIFLHIYRRYKFSSKRAVVWLP